MKILMVFPLYKWGSWSSQTLSKLPRVLQYGRGTGIWAGSTWAPDVRANLQATLPLQCGSFFLPSAFQIRSWFTASWAAAGRRLWSWPTWWSTGTWPWWTPSNKWPRTAASYPTGAFWSSSGNWTGSWCSRGDRPSTVRTPRSVSRSRRAPSRGQLDLWERRGKAENSSAPWLLLSQRRDMKPKLDSFQTILNFPGAGEQGGIHSGLWDEPGAWLHCKIAPTGFPAQLVTGERAGAVLLLLFFCKMEAEKST